MRILGCDPGISGALALIDTVEHTLSVIDMPTEATTKSRKLVSPAAMRDFLIKADPDAIFLEEVGVRPGEGAVGAFSFGRGFGRMEGVAAGALVQVWLARPQEWKRVTSTPADKTRAAARAYQIFPRCRDLLTGPRGGLKDGRCEAAIIAFYGCLKLGQVPTKPLVPLEFVL